MGNIHTDETPNVILKTKAQVSALQLPQEPLSSSSSRQESHGKDLRQSSDAKPSLPTAKVTAPDLKGWCVVTRDHEHALCFFFSGDKF